MPGTGSKVCLVTGISFYSFLHFFLHCKYCLQLLSPFYSFLWLLPPFYSFSSTTIYIHHCMYELLSRFSRTQLRVSFGYYHVLILLLIIPIVVASSIYDRSGCEKRSQQ